MPHQYRFPCSFRLQAELRRAGIPPKGALRQFGGFAADVHTATMTRPKRPRDPNQLAKMITDLSTRTTTEVDPDAEKDAKAVAKGRLGGAKGGRARAAALSGGQRSEIARKGAAARWKGRKKDV